MKACTLFIVLLIHITGFSQTSINGYKYVIVPQKFDFCKDDNQYGLNTTTRQLLENKGFVVFMDNEQLPLNVAGNRCSVLKAEVTQRKAMFTTNLTLLLKDCQGLVIFQGKEGKSREKDFPVAYDEALRNAFGSLNTLAYHYDSSLSTQPQTAAAPATATTTTSAPSGTTAPAPAPVPAAAVDMTGTLYAQVTPNGYQLIDTSPKKVLALLKTSVQDHYIADGAASHGVVFKKDNGWYFEHYEDGKLVSQKLDIKF